MTGHVVLAYALPPRELERLRGVLPCVDVSEGNSDVSAAPDVRRALAERVRAVLPGAVGLLCTRRLQVDEELIAAGPDLRVVSTATVGYEHIDVEACTRRGILVGNTPGIVAEATAETAWILLLMLLRTIPAALDHVRSGAWQRGVRLPDGHDPYGLTLGIVGLGAVGAAIARRARNIGMPVIYSNRTPRSDENQIGASYRDFDTLLSEADVVVLSLPLTPRTRGLFDKRVFAMMKRGAYFINVARGGIVLTEALVEALATGRLAGAGIDVVDPEPLPADHALLKFPNAVVFPHIGTATVETRAAMARLAVDNVIAALTGECLPASVNGKGVLTRI
ncbi:MAG TPA: D-glycerate dehydrogenase [Candidatus Baltobacteraceae bacterium]|jgi:glyoxylate reductase|nr:D-glycerate dehydrogenase [Candidatus Baltobacteraceae bacterium]